MSSKGSVHGIDPGGVADGDYVLTVAGGHVTGLTAAGGGSGVVESIVAGTGIAVDDTDPANPVVSATGGGGGGGGILAVKVHNPATLESKTSTSTTDADADATNLAVTFTAPASGKVIVNLTALSNMSATSGYYPVWSIRSGTTTLQRRYVHTILGSSIQHESTPTAKFYVTGLTPGNSYTYKWGLAVSGAGATAKFYCGGVAGGAVMEVHAAP